VRGGGADNNENNDQYEKIINQGLRTTGNNTWPPATMASGRMTAHAAPVICQPGGTNFVDRTTIPATERKDKVRTGQ